MVKGAFHVLQPGISIGNMDFEAFQLFMRRLLPAWATSIIKTWSNAWATTYRMHEPVLRTCVFGRSDGRDDFKHYLRCHRLLELLEPAVDLQFQSVAEMFFVISPTMERALRLVTAFLLYQSVKNNSGPESLQRLVEAARGQAMSAGRL